MSGRIVCVAPKVERNGDVVILTFAPHRDAGGSLARDLAGLPARAGGCHLLLDFTAVEYLNSTDLGTLIALHRRAEGAGERLTLFNLSASVFKLFTITRLDTLLEICRPDAAPVAAWAAGDRL
ncbi:STAS domain-containing protein [Frigoriglobus tundricola]|uniref:STAS domain-containing protein n=1 Tax=Frigoriglobus tundricola TaxID=2774151 RepID=A0A6M5YML7_9BACT|nr:STAS domain-containing protein [Frigoriglobus tundricola]QJW95185.1 hypothetical protein FTUN_2724 [Frigoriglobus tundricola]